MISTSIFTATLLASVAAGSPHEKRAQPLGPVIGLDFPDPSLWLNDGDGGDNLWYSFATNGNGKHVQAASAPAPRGPWTVLQDDPLPKIGAWSTGNDIWAPDVRKINGKYVLYYSATSKEDDKRHCVGTAVSDKIMGPYEPQDDVFACPLKEGGAIDPAGFQDDDGKNYVVYKVDGNAIGHGGLCNNWPPQNSFLIPIPVIPTPIMLQEVEGDGITRVGDPVEILDRDNNDGPLIEAPQIIHAEGTYVMFFSSSCYSSPLYDISYATAPSVKGPWKKAHKPVAPLMVTDRPYALTAPGGAQAGKDGKNILFHANCDKGRCAYERGIWIKDGVVGIINDF